MSERTKAKIIQFPRAVKQEAPEHTDVLTELRAALISATPITPEQISSKEKPAARNKNRTRTSQIAKPKEAITINGDHSQVINGNATINNTYNIDKPPTPTIIVQTGNGVIDAQQKRRLLDLRDEIVKDSVVRNTPKTPGAVMIGLNRHMKVNKYDEILADDFEKALNWMIRQRAILNGMRSAPRKLPAWRNGRIRAIHSRCKDKGFEDWRIEHMKKKFGTISMIDLPDTDLEALYRTVMSKK